MLKQQIQADIKEAMKAHDEVLLTVLRGAIAAINAKQMEKRYALAKANPALAEEELAKQSEFSDEEIVAVLGSEIKKRRDAIALYEQGNRPELVKAEKKEIAILQKYLPEQLAPEELKKLVEESVKATGAASIKDTGKIMADLMPKVKGRAEGSEIAKIIKELLS